MTLDTIFDAASLTKVVATTPCIMKLFEAGQAPAGRSGDELPAGISGRESDITVRLLMTHFSGMPPDLELIPRWSGYETGIRAGADWPSRCAPPGARFIYSDINFILLGEIVRRLSGKTLTAVRAGEVSMLRLG